MTKLNKDGTVSRQGQGGGQPPKYESEEHLMESIIDYLEQCDETKQMPNKAGCCLFLDISRFTYNEYKRKYPNALKRFEDTTENAWVQRLGGNSPTGAIFYLKNAFKEDWKDKNETDLTSGGKSFVVHISEEIAKKNDTASNPERNS